MSSQFSFTLMGFGVIESAGWRRPLLQFSRANVTVGIEESHVNALTHLSPAYHRDARHFPVLTACWRAILEQSLAGCSAYRPLLSHFATAHGDPLANAR